MRSVLGVLVILALLGGGALLAVRSGLLPFAGERVPEAADTVVMVVSPEAAESAAEKLDALRTEGRTARLSEAEITSLLRYGSDVWTLGGALPPVVSIRADTLHVSGTVATGRLPADPAIDAVRVFLPDTTEVQISGTIAPPIDERTLAFRIGSADVSGMPIPPRYIPAFLYRIGVPERNGLEPEVIAVPLPTEVGSARITDGELVLTPPTP